MATSIRLNPWTLLACIRGLLADNGALPIGVDPAKECAVLKAAYNDAAGVTAAWHPPLGPRSRPRLPCTASRISAMTPKAP